MGLKSTGYPPCEPQEKGKMEYWRNMIRAKPFLRVVSPVKTYEDISRPRCRYSMLAMGTFEWWTQSSTGSVVCPNTNSCATDLSRYGVDGGVVWIEHLCFPLVPQRYNTISYSNEPLYTNPAKLWPPMITRTSRPSTRRRAFRQCFWPTIHSPEDDSSDKY